MFEIKDNELKEYIKTLNKVSKSGYPKTVSSTLNRMAFLAVDEYKKNIKKTFTVRNIRSNIILKSIRYEKYTGSLDISKMEAKTGQASNTFGRKTDQLKKQEFGETLIAKGKHIAKPTKYSRGGRYKRVVLQELHLSNIRVKRIEDLVEHPAQSAYKQFRQAIGYAKRNPTKKFYFLPSEESYLGINGIAELKANDKKTANFVYSFKAKTQKLKAKPTLKPAAEKIAAKGAEIFKHEMQRRVFRELAKGSYKS